jgi:glycosyltransferase involved in cell wall biosynthesis
MHIRILAGRLDNRAGSHVYHNRLIRKLAARGHHVSVICFKSEPEIAAVADVMAIPRRVSPLPLAWRVQPCIEYLEGTRALKRLGLAAADVVIAGEHMFCREHHRLFPETPWIYLPHSLVVTHQIRANQMSSMMKLTTAWLYTSLQRWALAHADVTLRFTDFACDALRSHYGRNCARRFVVNRIGIDMPNPRPREPSTGPLKLLYVGQLIKGKRVDLLIDSLHNLRDRDWVCTIVGDGLSKDSVIERARNLHLLDRVTFVGHQADPSFWYSQADLLLFPSASESLGLVVLEAMSNGLPCLAIRSDERSTWNPLHELIEHEHNGFLAPDTTSFERTLSDLLSRRDVIAGAGASARRTIQLRHSWNSHIASYEELFDELVRGSRGY